ncbi:LmbE family N-acetylglucosaminyl deacetylase [Bradyrhizobium sp. LB7.1]
MKTGLVITAHPGDFVWRAGGAIALHAKKGFRMKIVCMSFGERGESQFAWKEKGATLESVKAGRKDEAERAAKLLGAEIEFFDCGDYPLKLNEAHFDRMVDIYRELNPSFVLTHALEDPYNFDHPNAAHFAQETRVVAQAMGHKPGAQYQYSAPPVVPVRAAPAGAVQLQTGPAPQDRRGLEGEVRGIPDPRCAKTSLGLLRARRA